MKGILRSDKLWFVILPFSVICLSCNEWHFT